MGQNTKFPFTAIINGREVVVSSDWIQQPNEEQVTPKITRLPDDPRLSPEATRKRTLAAANSPQQKGAAAQAGKAKWAKTVGKGKRKRRKKQPPLRLPKR